MRRYAGNSLSRVTLFSWVCGGALVACSPPVDTSDASDAGTDVSRDQSVTDGSDGSALDAMDAVIDTPVGDDVASDTMITDVVTDAGPPGAFGHDDDPVTLDGVQVPTLVAANVTRDRIAAFAWDGSAWVEAPVQIDPRKALPFSAALAPSDMQRITMTSIVTAGFYTDSNLAPGSGVTYVGNDPSTNFDGDDELVVLARSFAQRAPSGTAAPAGMRANSRVELHATDTLDASRSAYLYLFVRESAGTAPASQVTMNVAFPGSSGAFTSFYRTNTTVNSGGTAYGCGSSNWGVVFPEDTSVRGQTYARHFAGRWISDVMRVQNGASLGPDILDSQEARPGMAALTGSTTSTTATIAGSCGRSVTSFSGGPGTIITLRQGPIRAIRSVYGANSGTITQRTHLFYPRREDVITAMRVHPMPGMAEIFDLEPAATGMQYFDEHNTAGIRVDSAPDTYDRTYSHWQMVTGASQGTMLSVVGRLVVDLLSDTGPSYDPQTLYIDSAAAGCVCSGGNDHTMIGGHGFQILGPNALPNLDPLRGEAGKMYMQRTIYYLPGTTPVAEAQRRAAEIGSIRISVDGSSTSFDPNAVVCGDHVCEADETSASCSMDCPVPPNQPVCGDHTCFPYTEDYVCLGDCVPANHANWYACLDNSCAPQMEVCGGDPYCFAGLRCMEMCTNSATQCATMCRTNRVGDPGSQQMWDALMTCSTMASCTTQF